MSPCGFSSSYQLFGGACCIYLSGSSKKRQQVSKYQLLLTKLYSIISRSLESLSTPLSGYQILHFGILLPCFSSVVSKLMNLLQNCVRRKLCLQNIKLQDVVYVTKKKGFGYPFNTFCPHGVYILRGLSSHQSGAL
jgi:hypothetical protein